MAAVTIIRDTILIPKCTCPGSHGWLDHWEIFKDHKCTFCRGCSQQAIVKGVHVQKFEKGDTQNQYILPLCDSCAGNTSVLSVWSYDQLVLAVCPPTLSL